MSDFWPEQSILSCIVENTSELSKELLENEKKNFQLVRSAVRDLGGIPAMIHHSDMSNTIPDEKVSKNLFTNTWIISAKVPKVTGSWLFCFHLLCFLLGGYYLSVISLCKAFGSPQRNTSCSTHPDNLEKVQTKSRSKTPSGTPKKGKH